MEVVATVMVIFLLKISKQFGRNPCHQRKCFPVNKFQITNKNPLKVLSHEAEAELR